MAGNNSTSSKWITRIQAKLKRKPRSGMYVPEIDGLRFIAILAVVLFHAHIYFFADPLISNFTEVSPTKWVEYAIGKGWYGVQLFFIISGFIICLPFALHQLRDGKPVEMKKFFIRRFKRIEIPYFIVLTFSLLYLSLGSNHTFAELLPKYVAGITYTYNIFYYLDAGLNPLLPPAWTLELEIQFYLLAPFLSVIYAIKNTIVRRGLFIGLIIALNLYIPELHDLYPNIVFFSKNFILHNLPYFLIGMLVVDCFVTRKASDSDGASSVVSAGWDIVGVSAGLATLALLSFGHLFDYLPFSLGLFVLGVLNGKQLKRILSLRVFTLFGGMCYSIYLFHGAILNTSFYRFFPEFLTKTASYHLNYVGIIVMTAWIFVATIPLFLLVEKPFMGSRKSKKKSES